MCVGVCVCCVHKRVCVWMCVDVGVCVGGCECVDVGVCVCGCKYFALCIYVCVWVCVDVGECVGVVVCRCGYVYGTICVWFVHACVCGCM